MDLDREDVLSLLAGEGRHIVRERVGRFDHSVPVIKTEDGSDLEIDLGGFAFYPVEVPDQVFESLRREAIIREDGSDADGNAVYRVMGEQGASRLAA